MVKIIEKSGETMEEAIIILEAENSFIGVNFEYEYLDKKYGKQNIDWKLISQALYEKDGKMYDLLYIELSDGSKKSIYFDVNDFFGKL
ncbi:MAG: hypothetical protein ACTSW1_12145 [Candidatus Hodarchaeales archaeon]